MSSTSKGRLQLATYTLTLNQPAKLRIIHDRFFGSSWRIKINPEFCKDITSLTDHVLEMSEGPSNRSRTRGRSAKPLQLPCYQISLWINIAQ